MHDHCLRAGCPDGGDEMDEFLPGIALVDTDAALHRDRDAHGGAHGGNALGNQLRLGHQAGTKTPRLHAIRRTADVQVDFIVTPVLTNACRSGELAWIATAKLQCQRVLAAVEVEQAMALAVDERRTGQHFRVEQRTARQQPYEETEVAIGPLHHRCNAEAMR